MRMRHAVVVAGLALGLMSGTANASYILDIDQVGTSVVATGNGSLDLSGASFDLTTSVAYGSSLKPSTPALTNGAGKVDVYSVLFDSVSPFGTGDTAFADLSTGLPVGGIFSKGYLFVPTGYKSGSFGTSTSTYLNTTLSDLGLTAGSSYTYNFSTGDEGSDSFIIDVGSVSAVPLPASAPMFGAALLALGAVGYGLKRKGKTTA